MKNRILSLVLALTLACSLLVLPVSAAGVVDEGDYDTLHWVLTDDGVVTISGTGTVDKDLNSAWSSWGSIITSVVIEPGVTGIGNYAFANNEYLTGITIPGSVANIGDGAFTFCKKLSSVIIGDGCVSIGYNAFSYCQNLRSAIIGTGVNSIGEGAFSECSKLAKVVLPDGITSIGKEAFLDCGSLESVTLPESLISIGEGAFEGCSGLKSVTIPDAAVIGDYAFLYCSSLTEINVSEENPNYRSDGGVLLNKSGTRLICCPEKKSGAYSIPDSVIDIMDYAFLGCTGLTSVTIPDGVTGIEEFTFCQCTGLRDVAIPDSVTSIGNRAFSGCSGLTDLTIPSSVTRIEEAAFQGCTGLTDLMLPDSVTHLEDRLYFGCTGLADVTIPDSVTSIGDGVFQGCSNLKTASIPESVTSIGGSIFSYCSSLERVTLPSSITSISGGMFTECRKLKEVTIPEGVTTIEMRAFRGCSGLTKVTIPGSVTSIEDYAFYGCGSLKYITILEGVASIGNSAFRECYPEDVYYGGTAKQWKAIAIGSYNTGLTNARIHYGYGASNKLKITSNPSDIIVPLGSPAVFSVTASGNNVSYKWQMKTPTGSWKNSTASGCTTNTVQTTATAARNGYQYRCVVTDAAGNSVISAAAAMTVVKPVVITGSPSDNVGEVGCVAGFVVIAEGDGLKYQWQYSDNNGQTWTNSSTNKSMVATCRITAARDGRLYRCVVTDAYGYTAVTNTAKVIVKSALSITGQPVNYTGAVGTTAAFKVTATGSDLSYQWQWKKPGGSWTDCTSATTGYNKATLKVEAAARRNGYQYRCIITSGTQTLTSSVVTLTVK